MGRLALCLALVVEGWGGVVYEWWGGFMGCGEG